MAIANAQALALRTMAERLERRSSPRFGGRILYCRVSQFGATKARQVLAALLRIGWEQKRQSDSPAPWPVKIGTTILSRFTTATKSAR